MDVAGVVGMGDFRNKVNVGRMNIHAGGRRIALVNGIAARNDRSTGRKIDCLVG